MEIVSEGSLECISRPGSCDNTRVRELAQQKHGSMGFLEELPPEDTVQSLNFNEEVDSEDDEIISRIEGDVFIEDIAERRTSNDSSVTEEEIPEEVINNYDASSSETAGHVAQHELFHTETTSQEPREMEVDPKIRKGLEKIRNLDNILANKMKREKEVKIQRRQLEKLWREEIKQLDIVREQEGHGKLDLGVGHALALGPPNYDDLPEDIESVSVTPVFPTQLIQDQHDSNYEPSSQQGYNSSCDSRIERETETLDMDNESSKRTRKKKGSNKSGSKGKTQNFVKRNIELAADAGNVIPMTEAEKKRLEELLSDDTDLLMVENTYCKGLAIPAGQGFTLDSDAMSSLSEIDSKLQDLVPKEEIDLLMSQDNWKLLEQSDTSQKSTSIKDFDNIGLGERILREEKEMREMKQRLEAIEHQLQSLYRESGDESEGLVSEEILAKLIGGSSRTTSRSTTVSESVLSALSSARTVKDPYGQEIQLSLQTSKDSCASRPDSKLSFSLEQSA